MQYAELKEELTGVVAKLVDSGQYVLGEELLQFEKEIALFLGARHAIGVSNGTDAIWAALKAFGIGAGDLVLAPSFTFFGTCSAILHAGAKPVFADVELETFNFSPTSVEEVLEKDHAHRIKAILPVHLYGQISKMDAILHMAKKRGIPVIEDACQAMGSKYHGHSAGTLGDVGCFSFFPTKNLGALGDAGLVTCRDDLVAKKIRMIRNHGQEQRYYHHLLGSNLRLDNMQAGFLRVFLKSLEAWVQKKRAIAEKYNQAFVPLAEKLRAPVVCADSYHSYHQYTIRVADGLRDSLFSFLQKREIGAAIYYPVPCHQQPVLNGLEKSAVSLENTERLSREVISLPISASLSEEQTQWVIDSVQEWVRGIKL